jgi:hypothetical protein
MHATRSTSGRTIRPRCKSAPAFTVTQITATNALKAKYGVVYKDRLVVGNAVGNEQRIGFSPAGDPMALVAHGGIAAGSWDPVSYWNTSLAISGLGALRAAILVFHRGSVAAEVSRRRP